jgi:hypothetical protein
LAVSVRLPTNAIQPIGPNNWLSFALQKTESSPAFAHRYRLSGMIHPHGKCIPMAQTDSRSSTNRSTLPNKSSGKGSTIAWAA